MADQSSRLIFLGLGATISLLSGFIMYKRATSFQKYNSEKKQVLRHKQNSSKESQNPILCTCAQKGISSVVLLQDMLPHFKAKDFSFRLDDPRVKLNDGFRTFVNGSKFKSVAYQKDKKGEHAFQIQCEIKNTFISEKIIHQKRRSDFNEHQQNLRPSTFARCSTLAILGVVIPDGENKFKIQAKFIGADFNDIISFWDHKITRDFLLCVLSGLGIALGGYLIYSNAKKRRSL